MGAKKVTKIVRLVDSHLTVADPAEDVEGFRVLDSSGAEIGIVDDLLIDEVLEKVHFLQVASGGFLGIGARKFLIAVEAVSHVGQQTVHIDHRRETLGGSPAYDPQLIDEVYTDAAYYDSVYGYYGYHDTTRRSGLWTARLDASEEKAPVAQEAGVDGTRRDSALRDGALYDGMAPRRESAGR